MARIWLLVSNEMSFFDGFCPIVAASGIAIGLRAIVSLNVVPVLIDRRDFRKTRWWICVQRDVGQGGDVGQRPIVRPGGPPASDLKR